MANVYQVTVRRVFAHDMARDRDKKYFKAGEQDYVIDSIFVNAIHEVVSLCKEEVSKIKQRTIGALERAITEGDRMQQATFELII